MYLIGLSQRAVLFLLRMENGFKPRTLFLEQGTNLGCRRGQNHKWVIGIEFPGLAFAEFQGAVEDFGFFFSLTCFEQMMTIVDKKCRPFAEKKKREKFLESSSTISL